MTKLGHFLEVRLDRVRPEALLRVGLSPAAKVLDLKGRLRCRGCGRKGRAGLSIRWRGEPRELAGCDPSSERQFPPSAGKKLAPRFARRSPSLALADAMVAV
jgi:hypothetical protein